MLGLDGIQRASSSRIGPRASVRSSRLTTIGLSRRFLAGSNAAADNHRIGNARSSFHGGLSRTRVRLPPPPPLHPSSAASSAQPLSEDQTDQIVIDIEVRGAETSNDGPLSAPEFRSLADPGGVPRSGRQNHRSVAGQRARSAQG